MKIRPGKIHQCEQEGGRNSCALILKSNLTQKLPRVWKKSLPSYDSAIKQSDIMFSWIDLFAAIP
jgi:hypothetical protein